MVGREAELEALMDAFEAAAGGRPQAVLVGAEAGGGKSRLVSEFAAEVRGRALVLAPGMRGLGRGGPAVRATDQLLAPLDGTCWKTSR